MCPTILCNILTRMLNSSIHDYFQIKQLLWTESCTVQSVEVYSQSSQSHCRALKNVSCSEWHFLSNGMVLTTALKFESGFVPSDKNVTQKTRLSLYTYMKVWARDTLLHVCLQCVSNCFTDKPDAKTLVLVFIQLLICCLQFLLWKHQTTNDAYMTVPKAPFGNRSRVQELLKL